MDWDKGDKFKKLAEKSKTKFPSDEEIREHEANQAIEDSYK